VASPPVGRTIMVKNGSDLSRGSSMLIATRCPWSSILMDVASRPGTPEFKIGCNVLETPKEWFN